MNEHTDLVAEFSAGRTEGHPQCYVYDNSRRMKIALIPLDIGEMEDQWRLASRIGQALSRDAGHDRRESKIFFSGLFTGFIAAAVLFSLSVTLTSLFL
jgi:hypothetical protein